MNVLYFLLGEMTAFQCLKMGDKCGERIEEKNLEPNASTVISVLTEAGGFLQFGAGLVYCYFVSNCKPSEFFL